MHADILTFNPAAEFFTEEQCYINELSNNRTDPDVSIAQARITPGVTTRWHRLHGITERYVIVSGTGRVEIGDLPATRVKAGDVVRIPPDCRQRIQNIGDEDLVFLAVCSPRFQQSAYEDIEAR